MNGTTFLYLACILAGFALIRLPLNDVLAPLDPLTVIVGVLAVLVFSCILIFNGIMALLGKRKI